MAMTPKQIAAGFLHKHLKVISAELNGMLPAEVSAIAGTARLGDKKSDEIKKQANKLLDPFMTRLEKLGTKRSERVEDGADGTKT